MGLPQLIISIILGAAMLATSMNYLNKAQVFESITASEMTSAFGVMEAAWHAFREANEILACANPIEPSGCAKWEVSSAGYLNAATWSEDLVPQYTLLPKAPGEFTWSYGETSYGHYFCTSGTGNESLLNAGLRFQTKQATNQV